jgi:hypothetical protein
MEKYYLVKKTLEIYDIFYGNTQIHTHFIARFPWDVGPLHADSRLKRISNMFGRALGRLAKKRALQGDKGT